MFGHFIFRNIVLYICYINNNKKQTIMQTITIYRIEHIEKGTGIFHTFRGSLDMKSQLSCALFLLQLHNTAEFPTLNEDIELMQQLKDYNGPLEEFFFAYNNKHKICETIRYQNDWLLELKEVGFDVFELEVLCDNTFQSEYQTIFKKENIISKKSVFADIMCINMGA